MSNQIFEPLPYHDSRTVAENGRKYFAKTSSKCTTCSQPDRVMYVKQKVSGPNLVLECPWCDTVLTVKPDMVELVEGQIDIVSPHKVE